jgi:type III secretion protein V
MLATKRARGGRAGGARADLVLALFVVAVIAMMVVPLPTPLVDLLIALNLGFGVLLIAAALFMRDALGFAAFPTLLLLSTLYRLALNVASTRLILLQADAGRVIEAFGSYVVRGDYRVGGLVFVMLTLIQFIVIARGAERVAEVGARFSLDALPGKQLAIDAELRAGTLRPEQARARRSRLERESQLYGALDGALKFVKGDAIAGIAITAINFVGGVSLGVFARDLELGPSLATYGLLTVGDGLVTQIPALLGATAAGLVVTRVAPDDAGSSLAQDIAKTLLDEPRALAVGALVSLGLAAVPGLPSWPFLVVSLGSGGAAWAAVQRSGRARGAVREAHRSVPDGLYLELGAPLYARFAARDELDAGLSSALAQARSTMLDTLGVALPVPTPRLADELGAAQFRWLYRELPGPTHDLHAGGELAPALVSSFSSLSQQRLPEALDLERVQHMVDALEREQPALVRLTLPRPLTPQRLAEVLRELVSEGVAIRWLAEIVEAIAPLAARDAPLHALVDAARTALAPRISHALAPGGALHVLRLSPMLEEALSDGLRRDGEHERLVLPPDLAQEIALSVAAAQRSVPAPGALLTQAALRRHVRGLLREHTPHLPVLSAHELAPHVRLSFAEPIGP